VVEFEHRCLRHWLFTAFLTIHFFDARPREIVDVMCAHETFRRTDCRSAETVQVLQIQVLHRRPSRLVHCFERGLSTRVYTGDLLSFQAA
jgi:hypothetical protein